MAFEWDLRWIEASFGEIDKYPQLKGFKDYRMPHAKFVDAYNTGTFFMGSGITKPIIIILGPSGSGKTFLINLFVEQMNAYFMQAMNSDPNFIPYVALEAKASESGNYNMIDFYKGILEGGDEPLIKKKIQKFPNEEQPRRLPGERGTTARPYRESVMTMFERRKVRFVFVDEGQEIFRVGYGKKKFEDRTNVLKALSNQGLQPGIYKTVFVMNGNYELLNSSSASSQLARRSRIVHLGRYHKEIATELKEFMAILANSELMLPLTCVPSLRAIAEYLFDGCYGCVGLLKPWLLEAAMTAIDENQTILTMDHLQKRALTEVQLKRIRSDADTGEQKMLGLLSVAKEEKEERKPKQEKTKKASTKPGQRKQIKDPTHTAHEIVVEP